MNHADVFRRCAFPHPQGGHAISMVERQLISLRDRNGQLEKQLLELIGWRPAQRWFDRKLHRLTLALLRAPDAALTLAVVQESLRSDFAIPFCAAALVGRAAGEHGLEEMLALQRRFCATISGAWIVHMWDQTPLMSRAPGSVPAAAKPGRLPMCHCLMVA